MLRVVKKCKICGTGFSSDNFNDFSCSTVCLSVYFQRCQKEKEFLQVKDKMKEKGFRKRLNKQKKKELKKQRRKEIILEKRARRVQKAKRYVSAPKSGNDSFYDSREWRELRYKAIKEYGRKCSACFATDRKIHVDHIKPISKYPELKLTFDNLQILCEDCNLGKSNKDETDWRACLEEPIT